MARIPVWTVGILLVLVGGILIWWSPGPTLRHGLGEALEIAGILSLAVDPFLKSRLLKEASEGIFHHLLGFDQQPEIKDRLKDLVFNTILFRRDFRVRFMIIPAGEGTVQLKIDHTGEIINPSDSAREFNQYLAFERATSPTACELSLLSSEVQYRIRGDFNEKPGEPDVLECTGPKITIKPRAHGIRYHVSATYTFTFPENFYYTLHFAHPTIGVLISVESPVQFVVGATPTPVYDERSWQYPKLFMAGEFVTVRWKRTQNEAGAIHRNCFGTAS